jgi:hypothetical protein
MKRLLWSLPLALSPLLTGCLGCLRPAEPPPPPPAPPALRAPAGMPALPPDPRAAKPNPGALPAGSGTIGTVSLAGEPVAGSALNKFFPDGVTFTQEKKGFSMGNLKGGGTLAITDLRSNPSARDDYKTSGESVAGYPAKRVGQQGLGVLVGDRYQVMVRGNKDAASALASVNLSGLAQLK